jgi:hypothetical protein
MTERFKHFGFYIACMLAGALVGLAAVTFDPTTGSGFVGKGDVQLAFGWNNAQLQQNASGLTFEYKTANTYSAVCTWVTGEGTRGEQTHNVTHTKTFGVNGNIASEPRVRNQITGFNLTGYIGTPEQTVGTLPVVGGACPGNQGHGGTWTSVTQTGITGGLYAVYNGTNVRLQ